MNFLKALGPRPGLTLRRYHRSVGAVAAAAVVMVALTGLAMNHKPLFGLDPQTTPPGRNRGAQTLDLSRAQEMAALAAGFEPGPGTKRLTAVSFDWEREVYIFRFNDPNHTQVVLDAWTGEVYDLGPRRAEWWVRRIHTALGGKVALLTDLAALALLFLVASGVFAIRETYRRISGNRAKVVPLSERRLRRDQGRT